MLFLPQTLGPALRPVPECQWFQLSGVKIRRVKAETVMFGRKCCGWHANKLTSFIKLLEENQLPVLNEFILDSETTALFTITIKS